MSRGLHRQQHHQESPLSQHCRNNRSQATGPGLKRGRTTGSGDCQHLFKDKAASGDQQKEHDVLWAQQPPARIKGTKPAVGAPQETPGGAGERRSRRSPDKAHGVTAACHPHQGALGAGTKPARSQKKGSRSHPGHSKLPLCSQAAPAQPRLPGTPECRSRVSSMMGRGHARLPFMSSPVCWGQRMREFFTLKILNYFNRITFAMDSV